MKNKNNFWLNLPKPFFALAPMADVTDVAFRMIIAKYGKPDVMWTEFVSADGLCLAPKKGKEKLLKSFEFTKAEKPIVAQIFGSCAVYIEEASRLIADLGFDGVDLNMGCPDKQIEKQLAGAAMIKNPALAKEIIRASKRGAVSGKNKIPVSVKTRIGFNRVQIEEWIPAILEEDIDALTVHARTRKEMSLVPANWDYVKRAVEIRNEMSKKTLIIGNGDVKNIEEGIARIKETGCDGVMIGRGIFGNPFLFSKKTGKNLESRIKNQDSTIKQRLIVLVEHTKLFEKKLKGFKNFAVMKKHFKAYVEGFDGAKELRTKLMETENSKQVKATVDNFLKKPFSSQ